jgi:hypothetical protein
VGGLALVGSLGKGLSAGGTLGVPKDLPIYPGAALIGVNENVTPIATIVNASWDADATLETVTAFYTARLNQQPWAINDMNDPNGTWAFQRTDGKMNGVIRLSANGQRTRINVLLLK